MAQVLISESHEDVRRLLVRMLTRLGHEPIVVTVPTPEQLLSADVLLVEPAAPIGVVIAQAAGLANPSLPLICASVTAPPAELAELGVVFTAWLVKPFTAAQLDAAIGRSLRIGRGPNVDRARRRDDNAA
jgi:CheY-like chemotaxis protein